MSAERLGQLTGRPAESILKTELTALQALKFDLIAYAPYKAIEGFFDDITDMVEAAAASGGGGGSAADDAAAAGLDPGVAELSEKQLAKAKAVAFSAADALMLSDAPLLHAPGRLALAAVRSGFNKLGIKLQRYVERVAQRSSSSSDGPDGDLRQQLQHLQAALAELDQLGAEGAKSVDQEHMVALNSKLKACRSLLQDGSGQAAAKAKAKAEKLARKAAKTAEQRNAAEASVGILPAGAAAEAAAAEHRPAKRLRQDE